MKHSAVILGDVLALLIVTLIGFASHGEFALSLAPRMAASFIPLCIGWFLLAPSLKLFDDATTRLKSELWRPTFVMLFAGPFAALLRGILLAAPIVPSFAVVLTLTGAVALTISRLICLSRRKQHGAA
jgi:hypothetical protein